MPKLKLNWVDFPGYHDIVDLVFVWGIQQIIPFCKNSKMPVAQSFFCRESQVGLGLLIIVITVNRINQADGTTDILESQFGKKIVFLIPV